MNKRIISILTALLLTAVTVLGMSACGAEPKTLEDYLAESPSAQQEIEEAVSGIENSDMDVWVSYKENRIFIRCQMKSTYKKSVLKEIRRSYKKYMKKHMEEPMLQAIAQIEQETGISGVTIRVRINNGNGKKIWAATYPKQEKTEAPAEETSAEDNAATEGSDAE